jgi:hypothetical protein
VPYKSLHPLRSALGGRLVLEAASEIVLGKSLAITPAGLFLGA